MHKKTFALDDGRCLSDEGEGIATFPVKVEEGVVYVDVSSATAPMACSEERDCDAPTATEAVAWRNA